MALLLIGPKLNRTYAWIGYDFPEIEYGVRRRDMWITFVIRVKC